jgi:hypothetical protein
MALGNLRARRSIRVQACSDRTRIRSSAGALRGRAIALPVLRTITGQKRCLTTR